MHRDIVRFTARICAIDRFTGKTASEFISRYHRLFVNYFETDDLSAVEKNGLNGLPEKELIDRAQRIARAETDDSGDCKAIGKNLASVFSRLSLEDEQKNLKDFYRYNLEPLSPESSFPCEKPDYNGREKLEKGFYGEMDALASDPPKDYKMFEVCFDRLCQKYMWCITASDYEGEDISLYDYQKLTEAITACLLENRSENPFALVMGDFSGIQKYIFGVSSPNHSGVAKRLRARSFYVDMVCRVMAQYIIDLFDLSRANILLQTGGKFYCMVPAINDSDEILLSAREKIDRYLYQTFHGAVSVNMAWMKCGDHDLETYSDAIVRLTELLTERKAHPFENILQDNSEWNEDTFFLYTDLNHKWICPQCGMEMINRSSEACPTCAMQMEMGRKLPRTKYIVYRRQETKNTYRIFDGYFIELVSGIRELNPDGAFLIEAVNRAGAGGDLISYPISQRYMANHIPTKNGEPKTFEEIAQQSVGMDKIAVLKADVDVLGFLFSQGLQTNKRHFGTISRVSTMSRMLDVFFSGYINELLCGDEKYENVYSVFSGGDDLFLIGPWDVMLGLASEVNDEFHRFTAQNNDITMSAAVSIFHNKEHVSSMAEYSEEQLDHAKNDVQEKIYPGKNGRNAICVMGQTFSWEDFKDQDTYAGRIGNLLRRKKVSANLLRRLVKYSDMYCKYLIDDDIWSLMFDPMFHYDRERNYRIDTKDGEGEWFRYNYIQSMEDAGSEVLNKNLYFAQTTIKIALNSTRRERG